jgi:diguanylate cyclase (GGDEF)-like protein
LTSPAEQVFELTAASVRGVIALLVFLMANSEWLRTRSDVFFHLRTAFLVSFAQQSLLLGALAGHIILGLGQPEHVQIAGHTLEAIFLITLCHAMAAHQAQRRLVVQRVTRRLLWIAAFGGLISLFWRGPGWEIGWETAKFFLLLLSIYLAVLLKPPIAVVRSLLLLLVGTASHLSNLWLWGGEQGMVRLLQEVFPAAGAASFLWAVHSGIIRETYTDALTGLRNRRFFLDRAPEEVDRAARREAPLALIMADLDHFKRYNDTFGHFEGDRLLQSVALIMSRHLRKYDIICRWGGEEFAILLPDTGAETAAAITERLRAAVAAAHGGPERRAPVTLSAGVAIYPSVGGGWETLQEAADSALYEAKNRRNRVVVWQ